MIVDVLRTKGWLSLQCAAVQDAILSVGRAQTFEAGTTIFSVGDPAGGCYAIIEGQIAVTVSENPSGPKIAHLAQPGTWYGEGAFMTRGTRIVGLEAVVPSILFHLPLVAMDRLAAKDPEWIRRFAQMLMANTGLALQAVDDLLIKDPSRRVAAVLIRCIGWDAEHGSLNISQAELGHLSNVSRKVVNRLLGEYAQRGWLITSYNRIEVTNVRALAAHAQGK
ncbi:Crp/Fnr family transcriptional regulator [Defluviimonas sp. D31]|uniref:Crp/Fnr family transcriptional regulator n=1 Tax=Defluviimonas sp. D31 TaxID=3083253 RepID=UPI00296E9198|nr:Crp/Fnr family transcriptional regulator [Defluviimonas sp. D31]MDW4551003.1 Crp/Fnr family transcriptional regulator [Defluviimonas sp. D31]